MACSPEALMAEAKCLLVLGRKQLIASWALQACEWPGPTPPGDRFVTEDDDPLISETGDNFVPETN